MAKDMPRLRPCHKVGQFIKGPTVHPPTPPETDAWVLLRAVQEGGSVVEEEAGPHVKTIHYEKK